MQIVITSYFFLEFPVVVVEIVEKLGEILREVEGWGFDVEVYRLMFGPRCGWFGSGIVGLGLGLRHRPPAGTATTISAAKTRMAARLYMGPFRLETGPACGAPGARVSVRSLLGRAGEKIEQHPD